MEEVIKAIRGEAVVTHYHPSRSAGRPLDETGKANLAAAMQSGALAYEVDRDGPDVLVIVGEVMDTYRIEMPD